MEWYVVGVILLSCITFPAGYLLGERGQAMTRRSRMGSVIFVVAIFAVAFGLFLLSALGKTG